MVVDAIVALGGNLNKQDTITKEKLSSVFFEDFDLKLDLDVFLFFNILEIYVSS